VKINFVGPLSRECLTLDHSTMSLFPMRAIISFGRVFGGIRSPRELRKILTIDNLRKWCVLVVSLCCMCKRSGAFVDHLLVHCDMAMTVWNAFFSRVGLAWVMPKRVVDLFACWRGMGGSLQSVAVWKMVLSCLM